MSHWQSFFDAYAERYDAEVFTQNTEAEVRFIVEHVRPPAGGRLLDLGCGTGRHSVGLAKLGYQVTGVDLSDGMLTVARRRADEAGVAVEWIQSDAACFDRPDAFDAAVCLCEGAMCLLAEGDDYLQRDQTILRNVHGSLRPGGRFLLNVLNAYRMIRAATDESIATGHFDPFTLTERSDVRELIPEAADLRIRERGYTPPEIHRMVQSVGFNVLGIYGGTAGTWNLQPPGLDEMELMVLAEKPNAGA